MEGGEKEIAEKNNEFEEGLAEVKQDEEGDLQLLKMCFVLMEDMVRSKKPYFSNDMCTVMVFLLKMMKRQTTLSTKMYETTSRNFYRMKELQQKLNAIQSKLDRYET